MPATSDLVDFAESSEAHVQPYNGNGLAITWDRGRFWQHIWDSGGNCPQAFYGESEYLESRVPTMISDYGKIMLKWAIMRIGEIARWRRGWPRIDVPAGLESVSAQWGFEQLTPITGRLTLDGAYIPMEMRTIFPLHPELNQLSLVMQIDFDELLAGYMYPSGVGSSPVSVVGLTSLVLTRAVGARMGFSCLKGR